MTRSWRPKTKQGLVAALLATLLVVGVGAVALGAIGSGPAPANDAFVDAEAVTYTFSGTTDGSSADAGEIAAGVASAEQGAVWYVWTAPASGWAYVTPAAATSPTMPEVRAYLGDAITSLTRVDRPATGSGTNGVSIPATAGQSYKLAVIGSGAGAPFELMVQQPTAGSLNDEPDAAVSVGATVAAASASGSPRQVAIDTLGGATAAPGEAPTGGQAAAHSVWYTWTAGPAGGTATFEALPRYGSSGPFRVAVYTAVDVDGTPGIGIADLTPAPGGATGGPFAVVGNTTYLVSVDGPEEFFELTVTSTGVASSEDTMPPTVSCDPAPTGWTNAEQVAVSCTATDEGSGLAMADDAAFTLSLVTTAGTEATDLVLAGRAVCDLAGNCTDVPAITGIHVDRKPPSVHCSSIGATWSAVAPSVECTALDEGAGLADATDARRAFTTVVPPGTEAQVSVPGGDICDAAGNCTTVGPFGPASVDTLAPTIVCDAAPSTPSTSQVEIACHVTDAGSGLADATDADVTLTTDVAAGSATDDASTDSHEVCDLAGNCATAGPFTGLVVDLAPPSVTCAPDDGKPVDAWRAGPFTFTCALADVGTGLLPGTPTAVTLRATLGDGATSATVEATPDGPTEACDVAGSCVPIGPITGLRIDRQAPTVVCPAAGDGWTKGTATITCPVADGDGSGIDGAATVTLTATAPAGQEGLFDTGTAQVCDRVGHCVTAGPVTGLRIDAKPPTISCDAPAGSYRVEARIPCRAVDAGSGLANPADATFALVTSVGDGRRNLAAQTGSREVCDVAGLCATAHPRTVSVDLTGAPGEGPAMTLPARITVLSTFDPVGPTAAPYDLPAVPGADEVQCRPRPGTVFGLGWTNVVCEAIDAQGTTLGSFPLVVKALPQLAPSATAVPGGAWRAVGVGFAPGSAVTVEIDGAAVQTGTAGGDGRISLALTVPTTVQTGDHLLVLRGHDAAGDPLLVVGPLQAVAADPGDQPPTVAPPGAPALPTAGPDVPADPGPPPARPDLGDIPAQPTTTLPGGTTTTIVLPPGGSTTTTAAGTGNGNGGAGGQGGFPFTHLPRTGADVAAWLGLAAALLAVGIVLVRARRAGAAN